MNASDVNASDGVSPDGPDFGPNGGPYVDTADAVVIGAGPNGLVAAALAARAGWSVLVLEASDRPGGAVRSEELTLPGVVHDVFSGFYPLALQSPVLRALDLTDCGVVWREAPVHNAHPLPDGSTALLLPDVDATADALGRLHRDDGAAWHELMRLGRRLDGPLSDVLYRPFPDVRGSLRVAARARGDLLDTVRTLVSPVATLVEDRFGAAATRSMLCGLGLHGDQPPDAAGTGIAALMLAWAAQHHGWPTPEGGAGALADALARRARRDGASVRCGARVARIHVRGGRAVAVETDDGAVVRVRRAVLADTTAPSLLLDLLGPDLVPPKVLRRLRRFRWGAGTCKVDWSVDGAVPWSDPDCGRAATVHLGDGVDDMRRYCDEFARGVLPSHPYLLVGQPSVADPTRAPEGTTTLWGYTHVPARPVGDATGELDTDVPGGWDVLGEAFADRLEERIEAAAPGFRARIRGRHVMTPRDFVARNANLVDGDIGSGTNAVTQQLVFRPLPGLWRYRMPVRGVYLVSASAHPGGGVHGGPAHAAWQVVRHDARLRRI